jgi:hypothetical protein
VNVVVEILAQLSEQTGLDQGHRGRLNAHLHLQRVSVITVPHGVRTVVSYLPAIEADGDDTQLVRVGEEARGDG